jgi:hypothetical protein
MVIETIKCCYVVILGDERIKMAENIHNPHKLLGYEKNATLITQYNIAEHSVVYILHFYVCFRYNNLIKVLKLLSILLLLVE